MTTSLLSSTTKLQPPCHFSLGPESVDCSPLAPWPRRLWERRSRTPHQAPAFRPRSPTPPHPLLKGSLHPMAQAQFDSGRVPADTRLNGISIVFNRSAAQQADLEALIAAQQNPSSPLYHQWLNPDQFAARFGMAQSDLDKVQTWLQQQGFSVDSVARSRNHDSLFRQRAPGRAGLPDPDALLHHRRRKALRSIDGAHASFRAGAGRDGSQKP